jgi:hypothetical protein
MRIAYTNINIFLLFLLTILITNSAVEAAPPPSKAACNAALQVVLVTDLDFGDFEGTNGGTIMVDIAGNRTTTGPVLAGGSVSAAAFDVWNNLAGCEKRNVSVTVPASITLNGPATMTADNFIKDPANKFKLTAPGIPTRVTVGATLNTTAGQASGGYTVPFSVQFDH